MNAIETKNLTKNYGKVRGITDLNLTVEEGEFFGFIGPNGAGKSTTIRTLLGLIQPTSGSASVLGQPLQKKASYLADIGYMPSEAMFYNEMKVGELIAFSAKMRKQDCSKEAAMLCDRLKLDTGKRVEELSLGNRKKAAIVCAMQHNPRLYILDEPTSGLDPLMQKEFFELLKERNRKGATIFFSSHVLSEVQHNCTRAAIVRDGRLAAMDRVENLSRTNTKKVTLHGVSQLPVSLEARSVTAAGDMVSFLYQGEIRTLLDEVGRLPIRDMTITEPELEEIFLHYYEEAGSGPVDQKAGGRCSRKQEVR
ncbi:MAG: ABC transporter ATP-binding protein [Lachnospiraceae bacterium]|nr:ABC transporter ATP-binding protein [Lachnospiraceae bacterium]